MRIKIIILVLSAYSIFNVTSAFSEEVPIPTKNSDTSQAIYEELRWLQAESVITIVTNRKITNDFIEHIYIDSFLLN